MRQIMLDTETTGLDYRLGDRVIEIGCVELVGRKQTQKVFHQYLNPDREIDPGAQAVHGISNEFLADKPRFNEVAKDFVEFIRGAELVIHGTVVGWTAPASAGLPKRSQDVWLSRPAGRHYATLHAVLTDPSRPVVAPPPAAPVTKRKPTTNGIGFEDYIRG